MIPHSAPSLGREEAEAAARVMASGHLAQGAEVRAFEEESAAFLGRRYAVAVSSGTAALHLTLDALGVRQDEPVALPSYACAALITAVTLQNAQPLLCDVGEHWNLDCASAEAARVAIVPHLFGKTSPIPANAFVIEDIAQSMGGGTGRASIAAITSFYATKLMTTGEGGMVFSDDEALAEHIRDRRDYDNRDEFIRRYAYKMTDIQAAIGRVQLAKLPGFLARRREIAQRYDEGLRGLPLTLPSASNHVYFRYVVATDRREHLEHHLNQAGIEAKRPVYRPAHHYLGGTLPRSEQAHCECLSLPIFPTMLATQADAVVESIQLFFD